MEKIESCVWGQEDVDGGTYNTSCGHYFTIIDGTPKDNDFKFCVFCGKVLEEAPVEQGEDD